MVSAIILAGGTGTRMNNKTKPKQFLTLHGKSILIHTIEHFEEHPEVEQIVVVCVGGWEKYLQRELLNNRIEKVRWIVPCGTTVQESIYNALSLIYNESKNLHEEIVLVHDGVRPLIDDKLISKVIEVVRAKRTAVAVSKATETIGVVDETGEIIALPDRTYSRIAKAPQGFYVADLMKAHLQVQGEGINWMIDSATLMKHCGYKLSTVECSQYNIKITTPSDFYVYRALYEAEENTQIFGL